MRVVDCTQLSVDYSSTVSRKFFICYVVFMVTHVVVPGMISQVSKIGWVQFCSINFFFSVLTVFTGIFFFTLALFGFSCLSSLGLFANERILFMRERCVTRNTYCFYASSDFYTERTDTIHHSRTFHPRCVK